MNKAWYWGFFMGTVAALVGFVGLALGKPFYYFPPLGNSPLVKIAQVTAVAIKNRRLTLPEHPDEIFEIKDKDTDSGEEIQTSSKLLYKAAILPEGVNPQPWKVCTVTQVEEVKLLTRMMPMIASRVIMNTCLAQLQTFPVHQGYFMDPYIFNKKFPSASIPVIPLFFIASLIPIYEFLVVPFVQKITGHSSGITQLQLRRVGLVLSVISTVVAGIVEAKRRDQAIKNPLKPISLFWLSLQHGIFGLADMFTVVGLMEFFYREAPAVHVVCAVVPVVWYFLSSAKKIICIMQR